MHPTKPDPKPQPGPVPAGDLFKRVLAKAKERAQ